LNGEQYLTHFLLERYGKIPILEVLKKLDAAIHDKEMTVGVLFNVVKFSFEGTELERRSYLSTIAKQLPTLKELSDKYPPNKTPNIDPAIERFWQGLGIFSPEEQKGVIRRLCENSDQSEVVKTLEKQIENLNRENFAQSELITNLEAENSELKNNSWVMKSKQGDCDRCKTKCEKGVLLAGELTSFLCDSCYEAWFLNTDQIRKDCKSLEDENEKLRDAKESLAKSILSELNVLREDPKNYDESLLYWDSIKEVFAKHEIELEAENPIKDETDIGFYNPVKPGK
jgi:hypothetical protein